MCEAVAEINLFLEPPTEKFVEFEFDRVIFTRNLTDMASEREKIKALSEKDDFEQGGREDRGDIKRSPQL